MIRGEVGLKLFAEDGVAIRRLKPGSVGEFSGRGASVDARLLDLASASRTGRSTDLEW